jgi:hypothetical protein
MPWRFISELGRNRAYCVRCRVARSCPTEEVTSTKLCRCFLSFAARQGPFFRAQSLKKRVLLSIPFFASRDDFLWGRLATCGRLSIGQLSLTSDTVCGLPLCGAGCQPVGNLRPIINQQLSHPHQDCGASTRGAADQPAPHPQVDSILMSRSHWRSWTMEELAICGRGMKRYPSLLPGLPRFSCSARSATDSRRFVALTAGLNTNLAQVNNLSA